MPVNGGDQSSFLSREAAIAPAGRLYDLAVNFRLIIWNQSMIIDRMRYRMLSRNKCPLPENHRLFLMNNQIEISTSKKFQQFLLVAYQLTSLW